MSDLRPFLEREARRIRSRPDALDAVRRRAGRRRITRRIAAGAVALALAGGGLGLAYAAFRSDRDALPGTGPIPGPTPTADAVVSGVIIGNQSSADSGAVFARALLAGEGQPTELMLLPEGDGDFTTIHCHPTREDDAVALRDRFFPGAELRPRIDPETILVSIGDDFIENNAATYDHFILVQDFMRRRVEGARADFLLATDAATAYHAGTGGLSLYGYANVKTFTTETLRRSEDETIAEVVFFGTDPETPIAGETLTVGDQEPEDGTPEILAAHLSIPPPPATTDDVMAFVEDFLQARSEGSGAGTYLGEDARRAYASHENGLDLLGYATGETKSRLVMYDRLSPTRHRVVVRFAASESSAAPAVWETLLVGWRPEGILVVLDAERGRPA
jgi:hypothetical protein